MNLLFHHVRLAKLFSIISSPSCPSPSVNLIYAQSSCPSHVSVRPAQGSILTRGRKFLHIFAARSASSAPSVSSSSQDHLLRVRVITKPPSSVSSSSQIHLIRTIVWHHFFISNTLSLASSYNIMVNRVVKRRECGFSFDLEVRVHNRGMQYTASKNVINTSQCSVIFPCHLGAEKTITNTPGTITGIGPLRNSALNTCIVL